MRRPWIKIEVATPDKPEICAIANRLKMDEDMVVGKLIRFWAWVAQNQVYGSNLGVTFDFIDRLVGRKGFASAVCQAGWLEEEDSIVSIPHFDRHNSTLARTRALTKTRVERHRKVSTRKPKSNEPSVTEVEAQSEPTHADGPGLVEDSTEGSELVEAEDVAPHQAFESESIVDESMETVTDEERNEELSINAILTFDALQSESVVESVMKGPPAELEPDEGEDLATVPAKAEKPSKKKEDLFDDQPMLF
ncbi:MAG: hypothetical protein V4662_03375 [Verrucomicrobiota bacterium]